MSTPHVKDDPNCDHMNRPPEGWTEPDRHDTISFTKWAGGHDEPPKRDGWDPFFIGVHGACWTRWIYRRINA